MRAFSYRSAARACAAGLVAWLAAAAGAAALTPVSDMEARQAAEAWLTQRLARAGGWDGAATASVSGLQAVYSTATPDWQLGYVATVEPAGYIFISPVRELPPVKSYSTSGAFDVTLADPRGFEAMTAKSLENALTVLEADAGTLDTRANQQAWDTFAPATVVTAATDASAGFSIATGLTASSLMNVSYNGATSLPFVVRDPLLADAPYSGRQVHYSGRYAGVPAWSSGVPFNRNCPEVRTTPEEIWLDRDDSKTFTQSAGMQDIKVYFPGGSWSTPVVPPVNADYPPRQTGLYFYDVNGTGVYSCSYDAGTFEMISGAPIWMDQDTDPTVAGLQGSGVYNPGVDIRVYPNPDAAAWSAVPDGAIGSQNQLYYSDTDFSTSYTNLTQRTHTALVRSFAEVMRYWEWPNQGVGSHSFQWAYHEEGKDAAITVPLTADFTHTYSWARMPLQIFGDSNGWYTMDATGTRLCSDAELTNVGQLFYDLGVCFEVDFQLANPTAALDQTLLDRFTQHFLFNSRAATYLARADFPDDSSWFDAISAELDARRPVVMRAFGEGDIFSNLVVDGYDKTAGSANLYMLHCDIGGSSHWYALDNIGGLPYGSPDEVLNLVMQQDAAVNLLPQRVKPAATAELFRDAGDATGDTLALGVQDSVNKYGQSLVQVSWSLSSSDSYYPTGRTAAIAQLEARMSRYGLTAASTATAVISGHGTSKITGSGSQPMDKLNVLTETQRQLVDQARYRLVGDVVLGLTPAPENKPVVKADIYAARLDDEAPLSSTVTLTVLLVENVGTHLGVVRDCLYTGAITLGSGETRVVSVADFPQPPPATWNLANASVIALLEAADGTLLQVQPLEKFLPGPNFSYDSDLDTWRPYLANAAPVAPTEVDLTQSADGLSITAMPVGAYDPDGDAITYVYDWYLNDLDTEIPAISQVAAGLAGATLTEADVIAQGLTWNDGDFWYCEVRVQDVWYNYVEVPLHKKNLHESAATLSNPVIISADAPAFNQAPTAPAFATLTPEAPAAGDSLACLTGGASDPDGDFFAYFYQWYRNNVAAPGYTDRALPYGVTAEGENWRCEVRVRDLWGAEGPVLTSATVTIVTSAISRPTGNQPPSVPAFATLTPSNPTVSDSLTCLTGGATDPDGDAIAYCYQWYCNNVQTVYADATLPYGVTNVSETWRCQVFARDQWGTEGPVLASAAVTIVGSASGRPAGNQPPSVPTSATVIPGNPNVGDSLTCIIGPATDPDGDVIVYCYRWYRNGVLAAYTATTLPHGVAAAGETWSCEVYARDQWGAKLTATPPFEPMVTISNTVTIGANQPPSAPATATLIPANPVVGDSLTCLAGGATDPNDDKIAYCYRWYRNSVLTTYTDAALPYGVTNLGDTWYCQVFARDQWGAEGPVLASASVTIATGTSGRPAGNQPPSAPASATLSPENPAVGDSLICIIGAATDPDGDVITYCYRWYKAPEPAGGADPVFVLTAYTDAALPHGVTNAGDAWRCQVFARDQWGAEGPVLTSAAITINRPPSAPAFVTVAPSSHPPVGNDSSFIDDDLVCFTGDAIDPDGDVIAYCYRWYRNNTLTAYTDAALPYGITNVGETWRCEVFARDQWGAEGPMLASNNVNIVGSTNGRPAGNQPPGAPASATLIPGNPTGGDSLACIVGAATDPDGDVIVYCYQWYRNGALTAYTAATLPYYITRPGDEWYCEVYARDQWGAKLTATLPFEPIVTISNTVTVDASAVNRPSAPGTVSIGPNEPSYTSILKCGEPVGISCADPYEAQFRWWYKPGSSWEPTTQTGRTVDMGVANIGSLWRCEVYGRNTVTGAIGPSLFSNVVRVRNFAPSAPTAKIVPQNARLTDDLQCIASGSEDLEDGQDLEYHYEWLLNGISSGFEGWGATAATVPARYLTSGQTWSCRVYTQDSLGARSAVVNSVNSTFVGIPPTAPTAVSVRPARPEQGDTLECVAQGSTDPDGGMVSYVYTWYKEVPVPANQTPPENPAFLPTPTGGYYWEASGSGASLSTGIYGDRWVCAACATDGVLTSASVGSQAVIVGNRPPSTPNVTISPALPRIGEAITCTPSGSSDPDGDLIVYSIKWYRNSETTFYSGTVLPAGRTLGGDTWRCVVTATDLWTPAATSPAAVVNISFVDAGPTAPAAVTISPAFPKAGAPLICTASGATDANGDPISYVFAWYRDGLVVPAYTTDTVPAGVTLTGEQWYCEAAAVAASQQSAFVASGAVTIGNVAPTKPTSVVLAPDPAGVVADLTCVAGGSLDPNGDAVTYLYEWQVIRGGVPFPGPTDYRVPMAQLQREDVWTCTVRATDGALFSDRVTSSPLTIQNLVPTVPTTAAIIPANPTTVDDLQCVAGGSIDPEGGSPSYQYTWYRNGIITSQSAARVPAAALAVGEKWACEVRAVDAEGALSPALMSNEVTILSANPSAPTVTVTPADASRSSTLVCTAEGSTDPLGGSVTYYFNWYINRGGSWQDSGITIATVAKGYLQDGDTWKCAVYTQNSRGFRSPTVTSNEALVTNHPPTPPTKASLAPPVAGIGGTITCSPVGATDRDGDALTYLFRWQNDGGTGTWVDSGDTTAVITVGAGQDGWSWRCWVSATDGLVISGEILSGNTVKVSGYAPTWSGTASVVVTSGSGKLTVTARGITDADPGQLDDVLCLFTWYRNGMDSGLRGEGTRSGSSPDYVWTADAPRAIMNPGEAWSCSATPVDPKGVTGQSRTSNTVVITNQAPPAPLSALISPPTPTVNNALRVTVSPTTPATDPDGDTAAYVYRWYKDGVLQDTYSGPLLPAGSTAIGDTWYVEVQSRDTFSDLSAIVRSNEVLVTNTGLDAYEWDNDAAAAQPLANNVVQRHALALGDVDWVTFSFDRLTSVRLTAPVETVAATSTAELTLYSAADLATPIVTAPTDIARVLGPGTYYLRLRPSSNTIGTPIYALLMNASPTVALGYDVRPVYTLTAANNITWGYFQVTTAATLTITRATTLGSGTLTLALYNTAQSSKLAETTATTLTYAFTPGIYYLRVTGGGIATNSSLSFNLALSPSSAAPAAHTAPADPAYVKLFPAAPVAGNRLHAVPAFSGQGNETWFYWYQNGVYRPDLSGKKQESTVITPTDPFFIGTGTYSPNDGVTSVDGAYIENGDSWRCEVVVRDSLGVASARIVSNEVTVGAVADWSMEFKTSCGDFTIGQAAAATDSWDEGIDENQPPLGLPFGSPLVSILGPDALHPSLCRDIRGFSRSVQYWVLSVPDKAAADTLTWDISKLPAGATLMLVEVAGPNGPVIPGSEVDLGAVGGSFSFNGASQDAPWYWIVAVTGGETYERVALGQGWNLISFALEADDDAAANVFTTGSLWQLQNKTEAEEKAYIYTTPTTLAPRTGYWALSPINQVIEHTGKPALTSTVSFKRGWNLVGPAATCVAPADPLLVREAIFGWSNPNVRRPAGETPDTDSEQYEVSSILKINFGYWIYVYDDVTLNLR